MKFLRPFFIFLRNQIFFQSYFFQNESKAIRSKRIQIIFMNYNSMFYSLMSMIVFRGYFLYLDPSSYQTTLCFFVFLPGMACLLILSKIYIMQNPVNQKENEKINLKNLELYENNLGFYSSILTSWMICILPFTIYFEFPKFNLGIQFMMSKLVLNYIDAAFIQTKTHSLINELVFYFSYFIIMNIQIFSYVNLFFIGSAAVSSYFIYTINFRCQSINYKILKKKNGLIKLNNEIFQTLNEPLLIINHSGNESIFKNDAFVELQKELSTQDDLLVLNHFRSKSNNTLKESIENERKYKFNEKNNHTITSFFNLFYPNHPSKYQAFSVRRIFHKLRCRNEDVIGIYFHNLGKEENAQILRTQINIMNKTIFSFIKDIFIQFNNLICMLELLKENIKHEGEYLMNAIMNCNEFIFENLNCLKDYLEILSKDFSLHLEYIDIQEFFNEIKHFFESTIMLKAINIKFQIDVSKNLTKIISDRKRMREIIINLLLNSYKYTEKGYITLSASLNFDHDLEFSIEDSGIGFTEEQIFRFNNSSEFLNNNSSEMNYILIGNKLWFCQSIVKKLKSKLIISSKKNVGSTCKFFISYERLKKHIEADIFRRSLSGTVMDSSNPNQPNICRYATIVPARTLTTLKLQKSKKYLVKPIQKSIIIAEKQEIMKFVICELILKVFRKAMIQVISQYQILEYSETLANRGEKFILILNIDKSNLDLLDHIKLIRKFSSEPIVGLTYFKDDKKWQKFIEVGVNHILLMPISLCELKKILSIYHYF